MWKLLGSTAVSKNMYQMCKRIPVSGGKMKEAGGKMKEVRRSGSVYMKDWHLSNKSQCATPQ
jgi:hypothetical protein